MKSPMEMWAHQIRKDMKEHGEPITPFSLAARMIIEDSRDVQIMFFGGIKPIDKKREREINDRIETIVFVAKSVTVN